MLRKHFINFQSELNLWTGDKPYGIRRECRLEGKRHVIIVDILKAPPLDRWSLIAADCVGNLRSTLDHLVYALAVRNTGKNPPPDARKLQFPICDTETSFQGEKKRGRINGLSAKAEAVSHHADGWDTRWAAGCLAKARIALPHRASLARRVGRTPSNSEPMK